MIPDTVDIGGTWNVLPPGIHNATLKEIEARYVLNDQRRKLYTGLSNAIGLLMLAGCRTVYLDGSYITDKPIPGDFDAIWDPLFMDVDLLDPIFLDFSNMRANQKNRFGGEFFPSIFLADGKKNFIDYFQIDKETGNKKGIICIQLFSS